MSKILKIRKPADYNAWVGQSDTHELVTVVNFSEVSPVHYSLNSYDVYGFFLQGNDEAADLIYGTGRYDYKADTLICVAPGQLGGKEDDGKPVNLTGWAVLFHPDILQGTALEKEIKNFPFFDYRINEALHMTTRERDIMIGLIKNLDNELKSQADIMQNRIIAGYINLLLRYAQRFYNRQFVTRTIVNNDVLSRFEILVKEYFADGRQMLHGLPTVQYCSDQLHLSANYLSDVIKRATGDTPNHYIKRHVIQLAKNMLAGGKNSSEAAYALGIDYPQHFARMFKKMTGLTPTEYIRNRSDQKK
ncbi:MAG: helix-turn-helix domain-containing protein [Duncaniella sp.]|nr:helix-turn-helix domain-containing protein [Duncaniella sp.]